MGIKQEGSSRQPASVAIAGQIDTAAKAYLDVVSQITRRRLIGGIKLPRPDTLRDLFLQQQAQWNEDGTYNLVDRVGKRGVEYTLFVAPNVPVTSRQIRSLAETLAVDLSNKRRDTEREAISEIFMDDVLYGQYTPEELSGNNGADPVRFGLLSDRMVSHFGDELFRHDEGFSNLQYHTPSVLEAVTVWYARNERNKLGSDGVLPSLKGPRVGDFDGVHHRSLNPKPDVSGKFSRPWTFMGAALDQLTLIGTESASQAFAAERYVIGSK